MTKALLLTALLLAGCKGESEAVECPDDSFLTYENFGEPFMLTWCTPCHSSYLTTLEDRQDAPEGVDFDSYDGIVTHAESIQIFTLETDAMPPAGGPGDDERDFLAEWLACGLPK